MAQDEGGIAVTPTTRVRVVGLSLLCLVSLFNYLDRYMLGILLPAIKADLQLTDAELGFISGIAFTIFYAVMGIPIGRLADRFSRRLVITGALALWSAMTATCGLAQNFLQLAVARVMVGVGEAGATPPSHSLISDLFPARSRATALSLYSMGSPFGILIGFMAGGFIVQSLGWRPALFAFGLPGLILATVIFFVLPEPPRGGVDGHALARTTPLPLREVLTTLLARRSFGHTILGSAFYALPWLGLMAWLPSYFTRRFDMPISEVGTKLAVVLGVSQLLGLAAGGLLSDRLAKRDARWYAWICAMASVTPVPFYALALLGPDPNTAFLALFPALFLGMFQGGPEFAVVQGAAGPRMRAVAVATYLVIVNLIGGTGSFMIGWLSDRLAPTLGYESLGSSILGVSVVFSFWSGWHFWRAGRSLPADFDSALRG
jgi:MFS family permease